MDTDSTYKYLLHLADDCLIMGHRLAEWCGHGPILEQDIAMTNHALDYIGQARMWYQYAAEIQGQGKDEDQLAYYRYEHEYLNSLLCELPNGNFGHTVTKMFLFTVYYYYLLSALRQSKDSRIAAIAEKAIKEVKYHFRWSMDWMLRLGDGTPKSHEFMQAAIDDLWNYTGELTEMATYEKAAFEAGVGANLTQVKSLFINHVNEVLKEATLSHPDSEWMHSGGKNGVHTEHMGYILADHQYVQRAYPNMSW